MKSLLFKWLLPAIIGVLLTSFARHPLYVSVTEIEHNAKEKSLEISCKIFTDDFEKTLRATYHMHVDLLKPAEHAAMNKLVSEYIMNHLKISVNGQSQKLEFKGFEQIEEGIFSYFEIDNVTQLQKLSIINTILYDYQPQQMGLIHVTVNGKRQSTKLVNPDEKAEFGF